MFDKFLTEYLALEDKLYESFDKLTDKDKQAIYTDFASGKSKFDIAKRLSVIYKDTFDNNEDSSINNITSFLKTNAMYLQIIKLYGTI